MATNIRQWTAALLYWAKSHNLTITRFTSAEASITLHHGKLYINTTDPTSWRLSTLGNGPLDDDHTVVTETPDHGVRIRRGPVGRLVDVHYSPAAGDAQKLGDASRSIAELIDDGPLRYDFLDRFIGEEAL